MLRRGSRPPAQGGGGPARVLPCGARVLCADRRELLEVERIAAALAEDQRAQRAVADALEELCPTPARESGWSSTHVTTPCRSASHSAVRRRVLGLARLHGQQHQRRVDHAAVQDPAHEVDRLPGRPSACRRARSRPASTDAESASSSACSARSTWWRSRAGCSCGSRPFRTIQERQHPCSAGRGDVRRLRGARGRRRRRGARARRRRPRTTGSCSRSAARPERVVKPRAALRLSASCSSDVLPIPARPRRPRRGSCRPRHSAADHRSREPPTRGRRAVVSVRWVAAVGDPADRKDTRAPVIVRHVRFRCGSGATHEPDGVWDHAVSGAEDAPGRPRTRRPHRTPPDSPGRRRRRPPGPSGTAGRPDRAASPARAAPTSGRASRPTARRAA